MNWSKLKRNKTNWKTRQDNICIIEGCTNKARVKDRCIYHYNIYRIYERMEV